jgi:hypothetical protein
LETLPGTTPSFVPLKSENPTETKVIDWKSIDHRSEFTKLLNSCLKNQNYQPFLDLAKTCSPSKIDFEIRSMENSNSNIDLFFEAIYSALCSRKDFEFTHALLNIFLKVI